MKYAADENFNGHILQALVRLKPGLDIIRIQDTLLLGAVDPLLLEWIDREQRILLTHDVTTMTHFAYLRLAEGKSFPGIFAVSSQAPLSRVIDDLLLLIDTSREDEWLARICYVPL